MENCCFGGQISNYNYTFFYGDTWRCFETVQQDFKVEVDSGWYAPGIINLPQLLPSVFIRILRCNNLTKGTRCKFLLQKWESDYVSVITHDFEERRTTLSLCLLRIVDLMGNPKVGMHSVEVRRFVTCIAVRRQRWLAALMERTTVFLEVLSKNGCNVIGEWACRCALLWRVLIVEWCSRSTSTECKMLRRVTLD